METGKIDLGAVRNVILDLGGVILELDVEGTIKAFHELGFPLLESSDAILAKHPFFYDFETGTISSEEFISKIQDISGRDVADEKIIAAWNTMILGCHTDIISLLRRLRKNYRLFLLSNTNAIHEIYYNRQLKRLHGIENLDQLFEKVYYSHQVKMRKPDPEIFRFVLRDSELSAGESLFIDDTLEHVETARSLGIQAYHLSSPERITDIL